MSANFIAQVIQNCPVDFTECPAGIDTSCVVKLTTDCFARMNAGLLAGGGGGQRGGGSNSLNFDTIIPYLVLHRVKLVNSKTTAPLGVVATVKGKLKVSASNFDTLVKVSKFLDTNEIKQINSILRNKPKDY